MSHFTQEMVVNVLFQTEGSERLGWWISQFTGLLWNHFNSFRPAEFHKILCLSWLDSMKRKMQFSWDYQTDSAISSSLSIETNPSSPLSFWGHQSWIQFLETLIGFFPFQGEEFAAHGSLFGGNGTRLGGRVSLYVSKCTTKFLPNPYLHKIDIINMTLEASI